MGRLLAPGRVLVALCLAAWSGNALCADDADAAGDDRQSVLISADFRLVASDGMTSYLDGGGGKLRFDNGDDGFRLGRLFLDYRLRLTDTLNARATLDTYGDHDNNPLDVTEIYLDWKPFPRNAWRWHTKLGAFYPPVSLENRAAGWSNGYTISSSAINTWLGEEFRTIGAEVTATWLGSQRGYGDLSLFASLYEYNDDVGLLLSFRGWSLNDRQTPLFGRLHFIPIFFLTPPADAEFRPGFEFFHKIDDRLGYYAGLEWKYGDSLVLRGMHYDNRADLSKFHYDWAWLTRFDSLGARFELPRDWTLIGQWMKGDTSVGFIPSGVTQYYLDFNSWFALASKRLGAHRLSLRYDDFGTDQTMGTGFRNWDNGNAWTFAYLFDVTDRLQIAFEWLRVHSLLTGRIMLGEPTDAVEKQVQLALRYTWRH
ncbi:MAG: hypothetical protein ACRETU_05780 [Steroidobacterales bacterium]